ncbi:MAG: flavodoxin family protein [Chloroflexi bacterium]|nr:flavodoxin family protein [Chloroflexota bacterium]
MKKEIVLKLPATVKILGINGSPRKAANTYEMVKFTLSAAQSMGYVETELIQLSDYHFSYCTDCKKCIGYNKPAGDPPMCYNDPQNQMHLFREKEEEADAILLGFPIYGGERPGLVRLSHDCIYAGGSPFFNEPDPSKASGRPFNYKPHATISQGGQMYAGQENCYWGGGFARSGFTCGSWPTAEDSEPQASYLGGMAACVDGMSVYRKDAWTPKGSRVSPPTTGIRQERTFRNLGKWLAVSAMMMKLARTACQEAEVPSLSAQWFARYAAAAPKPGSVLEKLVKEGKVTYVPPEELESRKKIRA